MPILLWYKIQKNVSSNRIQSTPSKFRSPGKKVGIKKKENSPFEIKLSRAKVSYLFTLLLAALKCEFKNSALIRCKADPAGAALCNIKAKCRIAAPLSCRRRIFKNRIRLPTYPICAQRFASMFWDTRCIC